MHFLPIKHRKLSIEVSSIVLAPYFSRFLAFLLDMTLAIVFGVFCLKVYFLPENFPGLQQVLSEKMTVYLNTLQTTSTTEAFVFDLKLTTQEQEGIHFIATFIFFVVWFYNALNEIFLKGSSLGKRVFQLQVVSSLNFEPLRIGDTILRAGLKTITLLIYFPILCIDYLLPLFNQKKQTLHDMICRTVVIVQPVLSENGEKNTDTDDLFE